MGDEKRRYKRLDIRIPARIQPLEDEGEPLEATIVNLGPDGAYCETPEELLQGCPVQLTFEIEGLRRPVSAEAVVRWVTIGRSPGGIGVQFTGLSPEEKDAIYHFIMVKLAQTRGRRR